MLRRHSWQQNEKVDMHKPFSRITTAGPAIALALAVTACGGGGDAELDDSPEAEAYRFRQAVMDVTAYKMLTVGGMARGEIDVDEDVFAKAVHDLEAMAGMATEGFMPQGIPEGSRAMPEIWENWEDFEQRAAEFQEAAQAVADAVDSGGFEEARPLVQPLVETCGGCHRNYRAPEE